MFFLYLDILVPVIERLKFLFSFVHRAVRVDLAVNHELTSIPRCSFELTGSYFGNARLDAIPVISMRKYYELGHDLAAWPVSTLRPFQFSRLHIQCGS